MEEILVIDENTSAARIPGFNKHSGHRMSLIPLNTGKLFTTLTLRPGPVAEPSISSETFLRSYLEAGLWLRCLGAQHHVRTLAASQSTRLARFAASAGIYTQLGLATEDALAMLVAWSLWVRDRSDNLPDLVYRINLRMSHELANYTAKEIEDIRGKAVSGKKINVDGRRYLKSLRDGVGERDLPQLFGIRLHPHPSVKLVPKSETLSRRMLPRIIAENLEVLTDFRSAMSSACYNKLKHGPQLIVDKPSAAAMRMGHSAEEYHAFRDLELIRLLLCGSKVSITEEEIANGERSAPFLLDDPDNARRLMDRAVVAPAVFMWTLGRYIYGTVFVGRQLPTRPADDGLVEMLEGYFSTLSG